MEQGSPSTVWARKFTEKAQEELSELMREIPDTWWSADPINLRAAHVECIDAFMFMLSIATALGMDADFFARVFYEKMGVNFDRQTTTYLKTDKNGVRDDAHVGLACEPPFTGEG